MPRHSIAIYRDFVLENLSKEIDISVTLIRDNRMAVGSYWSLRVDRHDKVYVLTMQKPPANRINVRYAQEIIKALRDIEYELGSESDGCVIIRGNDEKFWCTGLDLDEVEANPHANADGFFPVSAPGRVFTTPRHFDAN
jgi:enoyl-CoA hydratase/carnithine racemase